MPVPPSFFHAGAAVLPSPPAPPWNQAREKIPREKEQAIREREGAAVLFVVPIRSDHEGNDSTG
jgi:hypothetical protein